MSEEQATILEKVSAVHTTSAPVVEKRMKRAVDGKEYILPFDRNDATNLDHCIAIATELAKRASTDSKKVDVEDILASYFVSALDLSVRASLVPGLEAKVGGPGRQIDKAAKALAVALGISEAEARESVVKQRQERGLPV